MLGGKYIFCCSHLIPNHPFEASDLQEFLYHHMRLCPLVWPHWCRKEQLLWRASSSGRRNSYPRYFHSRRWLEWSCWQIQCRIGGIAWQTWPGGTRNREREGLPELPVWPSHRQTSFKKASQSPDHLHLRWMTTQIIYVLLCKTVHYHVRNVRVIPSGEIAKQHLLLVCDFRADRTYPSKKKRAKW